MTVSNPSAAAKPPPAVVVAPVATAPARPVSVTVQLPPAPPEKSDLSGDILTASVGLLGALLGAFIGAWASGQMTKRINQELESKKDNATMFSVYLKVSRIYSSAVFTKLDIEKSVLTAKSKHRALHTVYNPAANDPPLVHFEADELFRVARVGGDELMNDTAGLDDRSNGLSEVISQYRTQWLALTEKWAGEVSDEPGVAVTKFTDAELRKYAPRMAMLDMMLTQILEYADSVAIDAHKALVGVQQARADYFRRHDIAITMVNLDGNPVSIKFTPKAVSKKYSGSASHS